MAGDYATMIIRTKDEHGVDRWCGMDEFSIVVTDVAEEEKKRELLASEDEEVDKDDAHWLEDFVDIDFEDHMNGTYTVQYKLPHEGKYRVEVDFLGSFRGKPGPIRGSPFFVDAAEGTGIAAENTEIAEARVEAAKDMQTEAAEDLVAVQSKFAADPQDEELEEEVHEAEARVTMMTNEVKSAEFNLGLVQEKQKSAVDPAINEFESTLVIDNLKKTTRDLLNYSTEMLVLCTQALFSGGPFHPVLV